MDQQIHLLMDRLLQLVPQEIYEFASIFAEKRLDAYRADLCDACSIIGCGCSDSVFWGEFTAWLVAQGKVIFEEALQNPETLADVIEVDQREDIIDGRLIDVAFYAYEQKTGHEMPMLEYSRPMKLEGKFTESEDMPSNFPNLFRKFGDCL